MFVGCGDAKTYGTIQDVFKDSASIQVFIEGESKEFLTGTAEFESVINQTNKMLTGSHQMPAFGVSMDDLTRQELESGVWILYNFNQVCTNSEMPFDGLLINVNPEFSGFNIIRRYNGKYEGRCFYLDLNQTTMSDLYNLLVEL